MAGIPQPVGVVRPQRAAPAERDDALTQSQLEALSTKFPPGKYHRLCDELGRVYNDADGVLMQYCNNYKRALMDVFIEWKTRTRGSRRQMDAALRRAEVGGLVGTY